MTMGHIPNPADVPNLRLMHFNLAGLDHVKDNPVFRKWDINVTNSVGGPSPAVAEWVIGVVLGHYRQLFIFKELQRARTWRPVDLSKSNAPSSLYGKTMAILGYGSIGRQGMYQVSSGNVDFL